MLFSSSRIAFVVTASAIAAGCSKNAGTTPIGFCAATNTPSVIVVVVDGATGIPLAGAASGTLTKPGQSDTLLHGSAVTDSVLFGGTESGTFTVTVTRAGYGTWIRSGVVVTPTGVCSEVNTVDLRAPLQPTP